MVFDSTDFNLYIFYLKTDKSYLKTTEFFFQKSHYYRTSYRTYYRTKSQNSVTSQKSKIVSSVASTKDKYVLEAFHQAYQFEVLIVQIRQQSS